MSFTRTGVCRFEFQIIRGIHGLVHCSSGIPVPEFTWAVLLSGSSQVLAGSASSLEMGTEKCPVSLRVWRSLDSGIKEWFTLHPNGFHTVYSCDVNYHQKIVVVARQGKSLVIHQSRGFGGSTVLCVKALCMKRSSNHLPSPLYVNVDLPNMSCSGQLLCKNVNPTGDVVSLLGRIQGCALDSPLLRIGCLFWV